MIQLINTYSSEIISSLLVSVSDDDSFESSLDSFVIDCDDVDGVIAHEHDEAGVVLLLPKSTLKTIKMVQMSFNDLNK